MSQGPGRSRTASLRERLHRGDEILGGWCAIPNSLTAEIVGSVEFDWVCVDTQHGPIGPSELLLMIQALDATGAPVLVRVPGNDSAAIAWALDIGAGGVIVPMVNSVAEAEKAVSACRYAPAGNRSYGPTRAGLRNPAFNASNANETTVCVVQIETRQAISFVDHIAAVPGLDGLFVGPADLGLSLGGEDQDVQSDAFRAAARAVVSAARANQLAPGMFCGTVESAETARADGFTMLAIQSDVRFLRYAAIEALARLRPTALPTAR